MPVTIQPILDEPALIVEGTSRVLVVADIHLGMEWELQNSGITVPSQSSKGLNRIMEFIDRTGPDRLVLLGDVKHNVPRISWQEKEEVPRFIKGIASRVPLDILPGNHDGDIGYLVPDGMDVTMHPQKGTVMDNVGYFHGHTWPVPQILACEHIIMGHNHPTVRFTDTLGGISTEPVWIRTHFNQNKIEEHYDLANFQWADPEVIIMPAFCELCGGVAFNESMHDDLLGPVFASEAIDLDGAEAYLLDGTRLGKLAHLRKMGITKQRPRTKKPFLNGP